VRPVVTLTGASRIPVRAAATVAAALAAAGLVAGCSTTSETITGCSAGYVNIPSTRTDAASGAAGQPGLPQDVTVTLPTGQRLLVNSTGVTPLTPGSGAGGGFVDMTLAGQEYVIPDEAVPYLGSVLDPRLFDVTYLAQAELAAPGAGLPVTVTDSAGSAAALPGVTVTHAAAGTETGTITSSQAPALGGYLASQWSASGSGQSRTGPGRLPGIARITLAQPSGAPALPAAPQAPGTQSAGTQSSGGAAQTPSAGGSQQLAYHTLTVNVAGPAGQPVTAVGEVQNLSDARLGTYLIQPSTSGNPLAGATGPFVFSLPEGTYSLAFSILTPHPGGNSPEANYSAYDVDAALVVEPQVTLDSDETITLDASAARPYSVAVSPAVTSALTLSRIAYTRISETGGGCGGYTNTLAMGLVSAAGDGYPGDTISASPTQPVTMGTLGFDAYTTIFTSDPATSTQANPDYYLSFPSEGSIPQSLSYTVPQKDLTTVQQHLYSPASCPDISAEPTVYESWGDVQGMDGGFTPPLPADHTDYWYTSNPSLTWWQNNVTYQTTTGGLCWVLTEPVQRIHPGEVITQTWGQAPLVPSPVSVQAEQGGVSITENIFGAVTADLNPVEQQPQLTLCPACRQDDNAMLYLPLYGDSDPEHYQASGYLQSSLDFYRNGQPAFLSEDSPTSVRPFGLELPLLPGTASYQLDYGVPGMTPGASTQTDWTFTSSPADPAARLPQTEECAPDTSRSCSFLPLLYLSYDLALNSGDQAPAGQPFTVSFTVAHQQNEAAPAGVSATVSASYDGGQTWSAPQDAASQGGDRFAATIAQPALAATNGFVSLRVTAQDSAGDAVTQTIIDAYGLAS
jgi:hypothetical protein